MRALGKALGLPVDEAGALDRGLETNSVSDLYNSPALLERAERPGWRDLLSLSEQLAGFPKGLAQHPGGMLVSSIPIAVWEGRWERLKHALRQPLDGNRRHSLPPG